MTAAHPRTAIVHEWLDTVAGSEKVLEQMLLLFPGADLFALVDVLPGVERGRLVASGTLTERVITLHELRTADDVATVSSLRGWRPAMVRPDCGCHPCGVSGR